MSSSNGQDPLDIAEFAVAATPQLPRNPLFGPRPQPAAEAPAPETQADMQLRLEAALRRDGQTRVDTALREKAGAEPSAADPAAVKPREDFMQARIEQAVRAVFEGKYLRTQMPYAQARELVWLEQDLSRELTKRLTPPV